jgi:hypothetical protein
MVGWTYEKKQNLLALIVLLAIIGGEFGFIFSMLPLTNKLSTGEITKAEYEAQQAKVGVFLGFYIIGMILLIIILAVWMKVSQVEYEKSEIKKDSIQCPIKMDEFDTWIYLIQTNSDCSTRIRTTEDMKNILDQSEVLKSLVKSIESKVEGFQFDQSDIFKAMFSKDLIEFGKTLPKKDTKADPNKPETPETKPKDPKDPKDPKNPKAEPTEDPKKTVLIECQKDKEMHIAWEKVELATIITFMKEALATVLSKEQLEILDSEKLFLYYRPVAEIKRIDDPNVDPYDESKRKKADRLHGLRGFFYLLPVLERDYFDFRERIHPIDENLTLRKAYGNFHFKGFFSQGVAFLVDSRLVEQIPIKITDKSIADARAKALTFLTHLAVERDQELRDEIQDCRTDIVNLKRELDKKRDQELLRMLHDGELESQWRRTFTLSKINATSIFMLILGVIIGILIGIVFFSNSKNPIDLLNTTTNTGEILDVYQRIGIL